MLTSLKTALEATPLVYIGRDCERAIGLLNTTGYYIITNTSPLSTTLLKKASAGITIDEGRLLDTYELLQHKKTKKFLNALSRPRIVVFKNTPQIEEICEKNKWQLVNPSATLGSLIEEKLSQLQWLGELARYLPPHKVVQGKNLVWEGEPYIVQFNRAHTGTGTALITSEITVTLLQKKFPERELRVTKYISGPSFTNNNVVWGRHILVGNINYQITGLEPFTANPFATVGNDWALPKKLLTPKQKSKFTEIAEAVGNKLILSGWKGLYGIDVIVDDTSGLLYLIEINARQPASTTYESQLQKSPLEGGVGDVGVTTFEAHLSALLNIPYTEEQLISISNGAQLVKRIITTGEKITKKKITELTKLGLHTISYTNTDPGSDLLRIQSANSFTEGHTTLNKLGKKIQKILE
jgi:predicted ATP-grasp superfamily ATP-dependent carboligase